MDFDWREGKPFEHHWQDYRTRKDRSLKTVIDFGYDKYSKKGTYNACVKLIDIIWLRHPHHGRSEGIGLTQSRKHVVDNKYYAIPEPLREIFKI